MSTEIIGRDEILGHGPDFDDIFGLEEIVGRDTIERRRLRNRHMKGRLPVAAAGFEEILGCDRAAGAFVGRQEILGAFVGEDERELARDGSRADRTALQRMSSSGLEEILGLDEIVGRESRARRRARRRRHIQDLKARAAAGDQQAVAKLQKMQADLGLPATTTTPTTYPAATTPPASDPNYAIHLAPSATPATTAYQSSYQPQYAYQPQYTNQQQYAYQNPYYSSNSQDPIDVYQGDLVGRQEILGSFVGDEERELARDGSRADRAALRRVSSRAEPSGPTGPRSSAVRAASREGLGTLPGFPSMSSGYNGHWKFSRTSRTNGVETEMLDELRTRAAAGDPRAQKALAKINQQAAKLSGNVTISQDDRQAAKQVLQAAANSKKISRADLKRAIWLYSGKQSTVEERTAVGSKMIAYLNKNKVQLV